jgi:large subunit ribosomal protein L22
MAEETQTQAHKDRILAEIEAMEDAGEKRVVKTRSRKGKVKTEYVGHTLGIFDGYRYRKVRITQEMVGKPLKKLVPRIEGPSAKQRYLSIPPKKMRLVAELVKGLPVEKALDILNYSPRIAAHHLAKTVKSAAANVLSQEGTSHLHPEDLLVRNIIVDPAPSFHRIRFQSMGRVFRIHKRHCHVLVELEQRREQKAAPEKKTTRGRGRAAGKKTGERKKAAGRKAATGQAEKAKTAKTKTEKKKSAGRSKSTGAGKKSKKSESKASEE